jgi:Tol biopolymer transport system component
VISIGTKLGSYEILSQIGAGGMGEVYRARDSKLGRDVAIKVLPEAFARDADRMARFQREAKVLASLDHPNIATIHGLEESGGTCALVMQLVEGSTLADRIKAGPIPVDEAVRIAKQIADALEYAHEHGIIHRDLKPANIKVAPDDTVKILDFGLAKALEEDAASLDISTSPTLSQLATMQGVLLGTAAYMSPEQAKAKTVDRRADIWAFGCVLYEMLTGKQAFTGETVTDTLASIIKEEPDWNLLPSTTPMRVRVLLQRCLQKDPKQRLRDVGDARISLDEVLSGAPDLSLVGRADAAAVPLWRRVLPWAVAGVFAAAFAMVSGVYLREKPSVSAAAVQRFEITAPDVSGNLGGGLSPDGKSLVLLSSGGNGPRLWLRRMDSLEAHPVAGSERAVGVPFFSPDSRFIAFGTDDGKLKKVEIEGGPTEVLCDSNRPILGGFWTSDGKIIFGDPTRPPGLWEVPATGGLSSPLPGFEHSSDKYLFFPTPLPDGRHFLYVTGRQSVGDVYLASLDRKQGQQGSKKLLTGIVPGLVYVPSPDDPDIGFLLFVRGSSPGARTGTLMAQPFDLRRLDLAGDAVLIAQEVSQADFSASVTGTLIYRSGGAVFGLGQLAIFDRQGKILGMAGEPGNYRFVAFSPDGKRVAATRISQFSQNLWMMDLARGISTRFTFDSAMDLIPTWSPDGNRIAFGSNRGGHFYLYQRLSNGGGDDELIFKFDQGEGEGEEAIPLSWSSDGRFLLIADSGATSVATASILRLDANGHAAGKPFLFVQRGVGIDLHFSPGPQGRPLWVAYSSSESGRYEIYVRPFDPNSPTGTPPGGGKWQVSKEGGTSARWNNNGKELFYVAPDGTVMSVEVSGSNGAFQSGIPKALFKPKGLAPQTAEYFYWDASSDGKKFVFAVSPSASGVVPPARFTVVLNWQAALKK